jgi:type IV pilus assembly protein PilC
MPTFIAEVRDSKGNVKQEKIDAQTVESARTKLKTKYQFIQNIRPARSFDITKIDLKDLEAAINPVTVRDKAVFSRQFAAMVNAGVAMVRCLTVLSEQCNNPKLRKVSMSSRGLTSLMLCAATQTVSIRSMSVWCRLGKSVGYSMKSSIGWLKY